MLCAWYAPRSLHGQTYTPRVIQFEGPSGVQPAELLRLSGLQQGVPLTKAEIETALQKLADTGSFTDLSYTVNEAALTVRLTSAAGGQVLPVRFANLPWWPPEDLLKLLETRVPLFRGELPLRGSLTDEVETALVALLRDKGVPDARVTAMQSTSHAGGPMDAIALSLESPQVVIGETRFHGTVPALAASLQAFGGSLNGQDFDSAETAQTVRQTFSEISEDAGYLDARADDPVYAAPRKDRDRYVVDEEVTLEAGELYRISSIDLRPSAPLTESDLRRALQLKAGDPASASALRVAQLQLARPYVERAYLLARATATVNKDAAAHTASYIVSFSPGDQFHFATLDANALPPELQTEFARSWHGAPGALVDQAFRTSLLQAVRGLHGSARVLPNERLQASDHSVTIVLSLSGGSAPRS